MKIVLSSQRRETPLFLITKLNVAALTLRACKATICFVKRDGT